MAVLSVPDFRKPKDDKGRFTGDGRLHVGWRKGDATKVWYMPVPNAEPDEDGTVPKAFYNKPDGPAGIRMPMDGEVDYIPIFGPRNDMSTSKTERNRLHEQYLNQIWEFLNEEHGPAVRRLEKELTSAFKQPFWQTGVRYVRDWKKLQMNPPTCAQCQTSTNAPAQGATANFAYDDGGEESGYESNEDDEAWDEFIRSGPPRGISSSPMRPPPRPTSRDNKRRSSSQNSGRPSKRGRSSASTGRNGAARPWSPSMTGPLFEPPSPNNNGPWRPPTVPPAPESVEDDDPNWGFDNTPAPYPDGRRGDGFGHVHLGEAGISPRRNLHARASTVPDEDLSSGGAPGAIGWQQENNGLDDDEALQRAMRESQQPEDRQSGAGYGEHYSIFGTGALSTGQSGVTGEDDPAPQTARPSQQPDDTHPENGGMADDEALTAAIAASEEEARRERERRSATNGPDGVTDAGIQPGETQAQIGQTDGAHGDNDATRSPSDGARPGDDHPGGSPNNSTNGGGGTAQLPAQGAEPDPTSLEDDPDDETMG